MTISGLSQSKGFLEEVYRYIEDPGPFEWNREPGHVPLIPFASTQAALENDWHRSQGFLSLNGQWQFQWSENPAAVSQDFYRPDFNDAQWQSIRVPGNWEMQGFGDPVFRNITQPFQAKPPLVPHDYNPTGSYRKHFSLPANWQNKQVFLHMEAARSASFVGVNGNIDSRRTAIECLAPAAGQ